MLDFSPTRRSFITNTALAAFIFGFAPSLSFASAEAPKGPFTLPELGYAFNALTPTIDAKTMEIHLTKHHQAYIDKLNSEVAKTTSLKGKSVGSPGTELEFAL